MADHFDAMYQAGTPPWDIGAAQRAFIDLADRGLITGRVIDIGCGTGENALHLASRGIDVLGVDGSPTAIERARTKARQRALNALFEVRDVLALHDLGSSFDCAIDSGCFHVFGDGERPRYVESVRAALHEGSRLFLMCFSEREPGDWGPRRVTQLELRETFSGAFVIDDIHAARFDVTLGRDAGSGISAWLAAMTAS